MNRAVFLDRDGTIIQEKDFLYRPEDVIVLAGAASALQRLQAAGFLLFIVASLLYRHSRGEFYYLRTFMLNYLLFFRVSFLSLDNNK